MEKKKITREFWIGFLGILSLVTIYLLINFFKGISIFDEGYTYHVRFNNIGEIVKTSPVYINGYKVGNVQEIDYDFKSGNGACVAITIDKRLQIPVGSIAEINKELLFAKISRELQLVLAVIRCKIIARNKSNKIAAPAQVLGNRLIPFGAGVNALVKPNAIAVLLHTSQNRHHKIPIAVRVADKNRRLISSI